MASPISTAWVQTPEGKSVPIVGTCSLGRSASCQVIIADEKASRRHAFIHCQGDDEYWLVDQGSSNGTWVNGKRIHQPTPLHDGDRISIVGAVFAFRHPAGVRRSFPTELTDQTVIQVRTQPCWLLLADIVGSSDLAQRVAAEQLALTVGSWLTDCKQDIEECGGTINKYLGDGFFAYWRNEPGLGLQVFHAIRRMMEKPQPGLPVRYVLHFGQVTMGGAPTMGEESLSGPDVNFIFRIEKIVAGLHLPFATSAAVPPRLPEIAFRSAGRHPVAGFPGEHELFKFAPDAAGPGSTPVDG